MATALSHDRSPLRISKVAGRYLLFDIDDVMYLRRYHNICSVFVGTIPQNPQQSLFMGLPLELMPEEAQVLVEKNVAYVADDVAFHPARLGAFDESSRRAYVQSLKSEGKRMQMAVIESNAARYQGKAKNSKKSQSKKPKDNSANDLLDGDIATEESNSLFNPAPLPKPTKNSPNEIEGYVLSATTSSFLLSSAQQSELEHPATVDVPVSYPLFAHLHDKGYYMMPGIRFGCDYNIYPGDPLRFHSHFLGVHFGWDEEITMMDLIVAGRLATTVKKGYLFGGAIVGETATGKTASERSIVSDEGENRKPIVSGTQVTPPARTFCLEWAGM